MQASRIGEEDMLSQLKQRHFGLRAFFATFPDIFHCEFTEDGDGAISATDGEGGPQPKGEFFVSLVDAPADEQEGLLIDAKIGSGEERPSLSGSSGSSGSGGSSGSSDSSGGRRDYVEDDMDAGLTEEGMVGAGAHYGAGAPFQPSSATVPKLRDELRRRGLSTLGRKTDLIERLVAAILVSSASGATAAPAAAVSTADPASAPVASKWGGRGELGRTEQLATAAAVASAAARAPPPSGAGAAAPSLSRRVPLIASDCLWLPLMSASDGSCRSVALQAVPLARGSGRWWREQPQAGGRGRALAPGECARLPARGGRCRLVAQRWAAPGFARPAREAQAAVFGPVPLSSAQRPALPHRAAFGR